VRFANGRYTTQAVVLPSNTQSLLGAIPIEDMDVLIHPAKQELVVHPDHPYLAQFAMWGGRISTLRCKWQKSGLSRKILPPTPQNTPSPPSP
jgi:hypothetical protein